MAGRYNKPVWYWRESAHKSRVRGNVTLGDCMRGNQHLLGDVGDHQRGLGRSQPAVDSVEPNSKEILLRLRQHFVEARILSTQEFCRQEIFVDARFLSPPLISDATNISVGANILSPPMFCRHQYFVAANIFACVWDQG
jgi:hypothetical protein